MERLTASVVEEQERFVQPVFTDIIMGAFSKSTQDCFLAVFGCFLCFGKTFLGPMPFT